MKLITRINSGNLSKSWDRGRVISWTTLWSSPWFGAWSGDDAWAKTWTVSLAWSDSWSNDSWFCRIF